MNSWASCWLLLHRHVNKLTVQKQVSLACFHFTSSGNADLLLAYCPCFRREMKPSSEVVPLGQEQLVLMQTGGCFFYPFSLLPGRPNISQHATWRKSALLPSVVREDEAAADNHAQVTSYREIYSYITVAELIRRPDWLIICRRKCFRGLIKFLLTPQLWKFSDFLRESGDVLHRCQRSLFIRLFLY